ncbi:glycosidase [Verrucomicrobia bacterium LW23]|nr:glycosidase [Verrucomicrobia bacterium LW23]
MSATPLVEPIAAATAISRYSANPVLQASDIPYDASLIFNAGVAKYQGQYVMLFRNDACPGNEAGWIDWREGRREHPPRFETSMGFATSKDGIKWDVAAKPCWKIADDEVLRVYDPRITILEGVAYVCFAMDTKHGVRGGVARTEDFSRFDILSLSTPDNRNMVLFPEKVGGKYMRLERPFPVYSRGRDRFDLWSGASPDLRYWGDHELVLGVEHVPFANDKIGPGAPPVRTSRGWLTTFHSVWRDPAINLRGWEKTWHKRYDAGIMLLDLENPSRVIGMFKEPLLTPVTPYERNGFRNDVIFPGGMILEDSGEVKIYYGAADTVEALATAHVDDLVALCTEAR